jgi:GT2 family glycosyltransferase
MLCSVIIPTCQRNDLLAKCLACLAPGAQEGAQLLEAGSQPAAAALPLYEVIVTDDGSATTAREFMAHKYPWARWVAGPRKGPAANRNNGAKNARGEWLLFTDDDCLPDAGWVRAVATLAAGGEVDVVEGCTVTPDKVDNPFLQGVENLNGGSYWSCNLAVRRAAFLDLGGFDEDFLEAAGEDMEFGFRLRQRGLRPRFCREALVRHPVRRVSFQRLIWMTRGVRWMSLYYLKIGAAPPLGSSAFRSGTWFAGTMFMSMLRRSWHFFQRFDQSGWRTNLFWRFWDWLTFPLLLPYLLIWDRRFRRQLSARMDKMKPDRRLSPLAL